jgi:hypothetical protein
MSNHKNTQEDAAIRRSKQPRATVLKLGVLIALLAVGGAATASADEDVEALAKKSQNPVAAMISAPFQNNFNFGMGPDKEMGYNLNIQPVVPLSLSSNWNYIVRPIIPILDIPLGGGHRAAGLGDLTLETFFTPNNESSVIWGLGPMAVFPTATEQALGNGQWNLGPAAVGVVTHGHWVVGALITQSFSVAGENGRSATAPFGLQPFINYNLPHGWAISTSPTFTADWQADGDHAWTVPVGGSIARTMIVAKQPLTLSVSAYYNVDKPKYQADYQIRLTLTFMFPSK